MGTISHNRKLEEELERYKLIVKSLPDGIFTFDLQGKVTSVNDIVLSYGYKKEDVIGKSLLEFIPEKSWPMISEHLADLAEGKSTQGEVELKTKKGTVIAEFRSNPIKQRGEIVGFQSIVIEITDRKKTEEALRGSEQKLRGVIETSPDAIVWVDTTGKITLVNRKGFELTGFSEEDLIGKNFMDVEALTQESKEKILESFVKRLEGIDTPPYEVEVVTKDGEIIPAELSSSLIFERGKIVGTQSIFMDLRERKKAEEQLRESEERLRQLIDYAPDGIFLYDSMGKFIDGNRQAEEMTGYKKEELIGKNFLTVGLLPMEYLQKAVEILAKGRAGQRTGPLELELIKKDSSAVTVEISTFPVKREGKVEILGIARDITERKAMEKKLQEYAEHLEEMVEHRTKELTDSEKRYRVLYETIRDGISTTDMDGRIIDCNQTYVDMLGYSKDELKKLTYQQLTPKQWHQMEASIIKEQVVKRGYSEEYEKEYIRKDGTAFPISVKVGLFRDEDGKPKGMWGIIRDITERKRMEEQLLKSERMAAIGQLATMVGHDLRNPLSSIQNASYYLKMKLEASKDEKIKKMFEVMNKEINRANNIVKDLLDFARVKKPELKKVDLISSIQDALAQLKFPENVKFTTKFSEVPVIEADPDQLRRVFQNIALNGIQALPNGGELAVSARKNGSFIEVAFTDTGVGIPEENMDKIFTPLFTTKAQGVGLGLPICKNLVEGHNGRIEVKSKVGEGSTFTVKLPIHQTKGGEE